MPHACASSKTAAKEVKNFVAGRLTSRTAYCRGEVSSTTPTSTNRKILVVDDDADAAHMLGELLRGRGHEVEVACDVVSAFEVFQHFQPAVTILDLGLPVMDGYELLEHMREISPACRFIAVTGFGEKSDRDKTAAAGFFQHIVKPADIEVLLQAITAK